MAEHHNIQTVALVGNPNSGKTSLFNLLTGLNQKVGNYPGVTVDKKTGKMKAGENTLTVIDLPGTYSLYPRSLDEKVVIETLTDKQKPDAVIAVADMTQLERSLLLFSQIADLKLPTVLVLTMPDVAVEKQLKIDTKLLAEKLGNIAVVVINTRNGEGINQLRQVLQQPITSSQTDFCTVAAITQLEGQELPKSYLDYQIFYQNQLKSNPNFNAQKVQIQEIQLRYNVIRKIVNACVQKENRTKNEFSKKLDAWLTHKIGGYVIFLIILLLIFQAIFQWSSVPMDAIDATFAAISDGLKSVMPAGLLTDLLTDGILPGIGGIVIFAPQIALLFAGIAVLEETGYMARVVFLMDKLMRKFGLNGRSVVPLISGVACAIPAIMATRTIDNWKERLITIFVTPLMSCSARLPVFTILIGVAVPEIKLLGIFDLRGLALLGAYLIGFIAAILSAWVMKLLLQSKEKSFLLLELPDYKAPRWQNVGITVYEKVKTFVTEPGKIILAISVVLWALASFGPNNAMERAAATVVVPTDSTQFIIYQNEVAARKLQASYAGKIGQWIEPVIEPLGYDWKIGVALITSFAAREVFVSTISTLYSIGQDQEESTIQSRLKSEINPKTGKPRFTLAVSFSLLVFYIFAMQCMSTFAVVVRETKSWKWAWIQFFYLTFLAYAAAWGVYHLLEK
jgi:ferrous iron transport protein B